MITFAETVYQFVDSSEPFCAFGPFDLRIVECEGSDDAYAVLRGNYMLRSAPMGQSVGGHRGVVPWEDDPHKQNYAGPPLDVEKAFNEAQRLEDRTRAVRGGAFAGSMTADDLIATGAPDDCGLDELVIANEMDGFADAPYYIAGLPLEIEVDACLSHPRQRTVGNLIALIEMARYRAKTARVLANVNGAFLRLAGRERYRQAVPFVMNTYAQRARDAGQLRQNDGPQADVAFLREMGDINRAMTADLVRLAKAAEDGLAAKARRAARRHERVRMTV